MSLMSYDEPKANQVKESSVLESIVSSFFNHLNSQESSIRGIENKLHSILDRNTPEKISDTPPNEPRDFIQRIQIEISRLDNNNARLERIYKHLSEIV